MASQPRIFTGTYTSRAGSPGVSFVVDARLRGRKPKRFAVGSCLREVYDVGRRTRSSHLRGDQLYNNNKKIPGLLCDTPEDEYACFLYYNGDGSFCVALDKPNSKINT